MECKIEFKKTETIKYVETFKIYVCYWKLRIPVVYRISNKYALKKNCENMCGYFHNSNPGACIILWGIINNFFCNQLLTVRFDEEEIRWCNINTASCFRSARQNVLWAIIIWLKFSPRRRCREEEKEEVFFNKIKSQTKNAFDKEKLLKVKKSYF